VIRTYPVRYCNRASSRWRSSCYCEWYHCSIWFVSSQKAYCIIKKMNMPARKLSTICVSLTHALIIILF